MAAKEKVLILDIDGSINLEYPSLVINSRLDLVRKDPYGKEIWNLFKKSAHNLNAKPQIIPLHYYPQIRKKFKYIHIVTARLETWREPTEAWLKKWGFEYDSLIMRPVEEMNTPSSELKKSLIYEHIKKRLKNVDKFSFYAVDDDKDICSVYEQEDIKSFQAPIDWADFLKELKIKDNKELSYNNRKVLISYLKKEKRKGKNLKAISEETGIRLGTIKYLSKKIKVSVNKKKEIDIKPFKRLDTEESAYIAGFTLASAFIEVDDKTKLPRIVWVGTREQLEKLAKTLKIKNKPESPFGYEWYYLRCSQKSLINLFIYRWGLSIYSDKLSNKTRDKFPEKIPAKNLKHFIRGYLDYSIDFFSNRYHINFNNSFIANRFYLELHNISPKNIKLNLGPVAFSDKDFTELYKKISNKKSFTLGKTYEILYAIH